MVSRQERITTISDLMGNIEQCGSRHEKEANAIEYFSYLERDDVIATFDLHNNFDCRFRRIICMKIVEFMKIESEFYLLNRHILDHVIEKYAFFPLEELLV